MTKRDLISIHELTAAEVRAVLDLAAKIKARRNDYRSALSGKILAMIFEKSSTRTRVSFEAGMTQLGGAAQFLSSRDIQLGRGEPVSDTARVLSRYVDGIMARTFAHQTVLDLATYATIPVINGLTDLLHPCQALTDYFTMSEKFGKPEGTEARVRRRRQQHGALAHVRRAEVRRGRRDRDAEGLRAGRGRHRERAGGRRGGGHEDARDERQEEAVEGAHVVYTDVWASMGQEAEQAKRVKDFAGWTVTNALMARADKDAVFMHCLPAHRGEEVAAEVCDGPRSVIFDEAENRLHVQKAILVTLMGAP